MAAALFIGQNPENGDYNQVRNPVNLALVFALKSDEYHILFSVTVLVFYVHN